MARCEPSLECQRRGASGLLRAWNAFFSHLTTGDGKRTGGHRTTRRKSFFTLLLVLLVDVANLLELLDDFFHLLASRGISFGLFNTVYKPLLL